MPELPEVEVVCRQLREVVLDKPITEVVGAVSKIVDHNKNFFTDLVGLSFVAIDRVGKLIVFHTTDPDIFVLCHLKMTGQLLYADDSNMAGGGHTLTASDLQLPHKHTHVQIKFSDTSTLYFNDMRKFGYIKMVSKQEKDIAVSKYGIEPIEPDFTYPVFANFFKSRKTTVKALLLRQDKIAGLGNIYVDEACYLAGVKPDRIAGELSTHELKKLFASCREVLVEAIKHGGTTFYDFRSATGDEGQYKKELKVFQREGESCLRCGGIIKKTRVAGRGTHWCPNCQR